MMCDTQPLRSRSFGLACQPKCGFKYPQILGSRRIVEVGNDYNKS